MSAAPARFPTLYERLRTWRSVEQLVGRETESDVVEFKTAAPTPQGPFSERDLDGLAKAISGLANVGGGTLVVGVKTSPKSRDVPDVAEGIQPGLPVDKMARRFDELLASLVEPLPAGIKRKTIAPRGRTEGVLVIYVPQSDGGPHRSRRDDHYYMRTATNTVRMPHALLADRFGRTAAPKLCIVVIYDVQIARISIVNEGRGHAQSIALKITPSGCFPNAVTIYGNFKMFNGAPGELLYVETAKQVLYPGTSALLGDARRIEHARSDLLPRIDATLYALNAQPVAVGGTLSLGKTVLRGSD